MRLWLAVSRRWQIINIEVWSVAVLADVVQLKDFIVNSGRRQDVPEKEKIGRKRKRGASERWKKTCGDGARSKSTSLGEKSMSGSGKKMETQ